MSTSRAIGITVAAMVLAGIATAAPATIRRRVDADGTVHLSNTPEPARAPRTPRAAEAPVAAPKAGVPAAGGCARRPASFPAVELFSAAWCPHCRHAREFFEANGIPFAYLDIEENASAAARYHQMAGNKPGLPLVRIGGTVVQGFDPARYWTALCPQA